MLPCCATGWRIGGGEFSVFWAAWQRLSNQEHDGHIMRRCTALLVMCMALIVWISSALPVSSATRNVVMLFDERLELPGVAAVEAELVRTLDSNSPDHIETYR